MAWEWDLIIENCTGCGICFDVCTFEAIRMPRDASYPQAEPGKCVGCLSCIKECPFNAIEVIEQPDKSLRGAAC
jgi:ferredoxin